MKSPTEDIIQELKSLNSDFLLKNKERDGVQNHSLELSTEFYKNVMTQIPAHESKVISLQSSATLLKKSSIFQIAASIVLIVSVSVLTYIFIAPRNPVISDQNNLQQLLSQTSSQEIYDYLNDNGMPADEEFLTEYVNTSSIGVFNLN